MEKELSATVTETLEGEPEVETPASDVIIDQDIDPSAWLEKDDSTQTATVRTNAGPLRIAAIDEAELDKLMNLSKRPDPQNPRQKKIDPLLLRRRIIVYSINKAYGYENPPGNFHDATKALQPTNPKLLRKLAGELTTIQKAVQKLSGIDDDESEKSEPENFLG